MGWREGEGGEGTASSQGRASRGGRGPTCPLHHKPPSRLASSPFARCGYKESIYRREGFNLQNQETGGREGRGGGGRTACGSKKAVLLKRGEGERLRRGE